MVQAEIQSTTKYKILTSAEALILCVFLDPVLSSLSAQPNAIIGALSFPTSCLLPPGEVWGLTADVLPSLFVLGFLWQTCFTRCKTKFKKENHTNIKIEMESFQTN